MHGQSKVISRLYNFLGFKDAKTLDNLNLVQESMSCVKQEKFPYLQHPGKRTKQA